jgi:hypothetical protein
MEKDCALLADLKRGIRCWCELSIRFESHFKKIIYAFMQLLRFETRADTVVKAKFKSASKAASFSKEISRYSELRYALCDW